MKIIVPKRNLTNSSNKRKLVKISTKEFESLLRKHKVVQESEESFWDGELEPDEFSEKILKDLSKVDFSFENYSCKETYGKYTDSMIGVHTTPKGLTFLGCNAGGDWEDPVFFILYWDGKSFRGYVPEAGNVYNKQTKSAFGNEDEERDEDEDVTKIFDEIAIFEDIENRFQ